MDKVILIAVGGSLTFSVVCYLLYSTAKKKNESLKLKVEELEYNLTCTQKENNILRAEMKLYSKLENETNEKISALDNGDLSADDILPK